VLGTQLRHPPIRLNAIATVKHREFNDLYTRLVSPLQAVISAVSCTCKITSDSQYPILNTQNPISRELKRKCPASEWLEHYTKNKKLKDGTIATFPRIDRLLVLLFEAMPTRDTSNAYYSQAKIEHECAGARWRLRGAHCRRQSHRADTLLNNKKYF
jgi:hypothetical protein